MVWVVFWGGFLFVCLKQDQLCMLPGDIQRLHLAAWGCDHFHDAGTDCCSLTMFFMDPLNQIMEEEGPDWAQTGKSIQTGKEAQPLQMDLGI